MSSLDADLLAPLLNFRKPSSATFQTANRRGQAFEVNFEPTVDDSGAHASKPDPTSPAPLSKPPDVLFDSLASHLCDTSPPFSFSPPRPFSGSAPVAQDSPVTAGTGTPDAEIAAVQLADNQRSTNMAPSGSSAAAGTASPQAKKSGLFGKFSTKKGKDPKVALAPSPSPVIRDLHPLPLPPALPSDLSPTPPALSGGSLNARVHTLSTASTLANPSVGAPLGTVATASSSGSSGIEAKQSPVPPFGSQRKLFFPITVLAATVQKKAFAMLPSGQDAHSQAAMSMFANSKGDWKKRVIAISSWSAKTTNVSPITGEDESVTFGWLHIFKQDGPSGKEVGRMRIGFNSVVGLLDPNTPAGEQAEGRKHVLSFTAGKKAKKPGVKRVKEIFGEAEERLIVQMESEEALQQWISEIKHFIFIKRSEMRGIGNAALALKERGEIMSGDIEILLDNLLTSETKKHAGRRPSATSVASTESSSSAAPTGRIIVPPTVVEARESSPSPIDDVGAPAATDEAPGAAVAAAETNSAQAAAQATDSLELLLTNANHLPNSLTSSSLGSSRTTDPAPITARPVLVISDDTAEFSNLLTIAGSPIPLTPPSQLQPSDATTTVTAADSSSEPSTMPFGEGLSYSHTFDAKQSPLPAFGCLRAALIPITALTAEVDKKARGFWHGGAHATAGLALFSGSKAKGDWKRRQLVLSSFNAVTASDEAGHAHRTTFACLHLFEQAGPSAREVGRMKLHASTLVGWLDSSAANGQEADGHKFVLSVLNQKKGSRSTERDLFGEVDERLLVAMSDEPTLKTWISELKRVAFVKRAENKGLGDQARGVQGKSFGDDLDHALHLLSESSLDAPSTAPIQDARSPSGAPVLEFSGPNGRLRSSDSIRQSDSVGERSEFSVSDHSSYQQTFDSSGTRSESLSSFAAHMSAPLSRDPSAASLEYNITRPVLVASSNADVAHLVQPTDTLPAARDTDDFRGSPHSTIAARRDSDYRTIEMLLSHRLGSHSPMSDHFSTAGESTRTVASASSAPEPEQVDPHRAEIDRLKRVEAELRSQLEIERLRAVEAELRGQLEIQRRRREEDERRRQQIEAIRRDGSLESDRRLVDPRDTGGLSDDSDIDPRGPTPCGKRIQSASGQLDFPRSSGSSTYSGYSARDSFAGHSDISSFQAMADRSAWDSAGSGRQDRQSSTTTVGSSVYYSDKEPMRSSPLSPPITSLSRRASSKLSSGPPTPVDEEEGSSFARPRSSSRSSYAGSRPAGLAPDFGGSSTTLASPNRHSKLMAGPPAPPPLSLPPPPPITYASAEMARKLSDPGSHQQEPRSFARRPSAGLETLSERPSGSGRSRAAMLRQGSLPPGPPPPSSGLPPTPM